MKMSFFQSILFIYLLYLRSYIILAQTTSAYRTSFPFVTSCPSSQYYDTATFQCSPCPTNARQSNDLRNCDCVNRTDYYVVNQGGGSLICSSCPANYEKTIDGFGCTQPLSAGSCITSTANNVLSQATIEGNLYGSGSSSTSNHPRVGSDQCVGCLSGTWPDFDGQRCTPCASVTPRISSTTASGNVQCCTSATTRGGICLDEIPQRTIGFINQNRFSSPGSSTFFEQHFETAFYLCRMNLDSQTAQSSTRVLLSNATACQVLGNIAAMQLYYGAVNYAYYNYDTYLWDPPQQIWQINTVRPAIPFLAYPSTFYGETTASTYDWIPATFYQNDLVTLKLAKYSPTGQYLGLFDALDNTIELCGGGYTDSRAAFTFGTQFNRTCIIRVDALWSSPLYETAFFDPYIVFTRSGVQYMLPIPVIIRNYISTTFTSPNQNAEESQSVYHRRFFLIDRISGIVNNELRNIRYARSIQIITTLTDGLTYIRPPVIYIDYAELSLSDIGQGTLVQVSFATTYRMNLDIHIRDIWIAVGVLSAVGIFLAFIRTSIWQSRTTKISIELVTIFKFFGYIFNTIATVFFIVMAGVSLWWLIFFKRQDAIYLVLPTTFQQASFTALVCVAFGLKTFDILHMIGRQVNADIFFIDWEKPKSESKNVSVWRTYFVANEFHEIQTFRRINPTFQLFFVLFLLKVINLENIARAQPGVNLFPSSNDYVPDYNGILRVGIAFSMWIATALVQYLFYVLIYQRFIQDRLVNFIDLCSVSNISVLILTDELYGYYIHGLSPHGATDVNMRDMLINLEREGQQMSGKRGLVAGSNEQTFIVKLVPNFRAQYVILLQNYQTGMNMPTTKGNEQMDSEILMTSYRNLNDFLCAFITHSLPAHNYYIRDRFFLEKIFNYEFQAATRPGVPALIDNIFFVDKQRGFTNALFSGHENSLLIWNMATFLFVDYFAFNYVLAGIITYLLNIIVNKLRLSFGRRNLSNKTLIPKEFLI